MNRILKWLILPALVLMQIPIRVDTTNAQDVRKRAEHYYKVFQTLQNLIYAEKDANNKFLTEQSRIWFQRWENEIHRNAVYPGYLGCSPNEVIHAVSLIRSKLESDAGYCMENILAEHEDLLNRSKEVAEATQKLADLSEEVSNLAPEHIDALLECMPDPRQDGIEEAVLEWAPPYIQQVGRAAPMIINHWNLFQSGFLETRRACFDFHALEYHGTTADIVHLFEECVRGDMTDWVYAESLPTEMEIQILFKIILRAAYIRPAKFIRTLTNMFDDQVKMSVNVVRKSHVAQATELIAHYESRNRTELSSQCSRYLPQLKSTYADLIRKSYQCIHGTYMNFLQSTKLMELDANDISRLTMNSTHLMDLQRHNMSLTELSYQLKAKVIPTYNSARKKDDEMQRQFDNDVTSVKTNMKTAFDCVKKLQLEADKLSLELSRDYAQCPNKVINQQIFAEKLESEHLIDALQRINQEYDKALHASFLSLQKWKSRFDGHLIVTPKRTHVCARACGTRAHAEMTTIQTTCWNQSVKHLQQVKYKLQKNFDRGLLLRKFIREGKTIEKVTIVQQCLRNAVLLSNPSAENFQINERSCGKHFALFQSNQVIRILKEYRYCFWLKCERTWKFVLRKWGVEVP